MSTAKKNGQKIGAEIVVKMGIGGVEETFWMKTRGWVGV